MATTKEEAVVRLGLNTTALDYGLQKVGHSIKESAVEFGRSLLTGFAIEKVIEKMYQAAEFVEQLSNRASTLKVSTDFLQDIENVAKAAGKSQQSVERMLATFVRTLPVGADIQKSFYATLDTLNNMHDASERMRMAYSLFGKQAADILDFAGKGSKQFAENAKEFLKFTHEEIEAIKQAKEEWERFGNASIVGSGKLLAFFTHGFQVLKIWAQTFNSGPVVAAKIAIAINEAAEAARKLREETSKTLDDAISKLDNRKSGGLFGQALSNVKEISKEFERINTLNEKLWSIQGRFQDRFMPSHDEILKSTKFGNIQRREDFLEQYVRDARLSGNMAGVRGGMAEIQRIDSYLDKVGVKKDPTKELVAEFQKLTGLTTEGALKVLIKNVD
jgi:DNA repair ATPase RecN